jgi:hypothetical protein
MAPSDYALNECTGKKRCNNVLPGPLSALACNACIWPHLYGTKLLAYILAIGEAAALPQTCNQFL